MGPPIKLLRKDIIHCASLFLLCLFYTLPWLGALEFFRHTEADRTLIGWEMYQRSDYIVPHLLGDPYLTKPPLYYWLLSAVFAISGSPSEFASRIPCALSAAFLVLLQYLFLRAIGAGTWAALLGAAILATSAQFFQLSLQGEIDMTYTLLCTATFYTWYLCRRQKSRVALRVLSSMLLALAFLTKGPPVFVFYLGAMLLYLPLALTRSPTAKNTTLGNLLLGEFCGLAITAAVISLWLIPLMLRVPLSELSQVWQQEIMTRFTADPMAWKRQRGAFFYLLSVAGGFMPWTAGLLLAPPFRSKFKDLSPASKDFIVYALCVCLPAFVVFSLASGKASRYFFPLYPLLSAILAIWFHTYLKSKFFKQLACATCLLALFARFPYVYLYAASRNERLSVKQAAHTLFQATHPMAPIYTIELMDRWLLYYSLRLGQTALRLTPKLASEFKTQVGKRIYLLLSAKEEAWRVEQIRSIDASAAVADTIHAPRADYILLEMDASKAHAIELSTVFPAAYSTAMGFTKNLFPSPSNNL